MGTNLAAKIDEVKNKLKKRGWENIHNLDSDAMYLKNAGVQCRYRFTASWVVYYEREICGQWMLMDKLDLGYVCDIFGKH